MWQCECGEYNVSSKTALDLNNPGRPVPDVCVACGRRLQDQLRPY